MKRLSIILVNSNLEFNNIKSEIEIIRTNGEEIRSAIQNAKGKYLTFICNNDYVSSNYIDIIFDKCSEDFDSCYINNKINYNLLKENVKSNLEEYFNTLKPYFLDYIWSFIFNKNILIKIIESNYRTFDKKSVNYIKKMDYISDIIYFHNAEKFENTLLDIPYVDYKKVEYYKNVIYIKDILTASFNGIITWLTNIGKLFFKDYEITLMYDEIYTGTLNYLSKYFNMVQRNKYTNYICDRYISTYMDYEIPNNVFYAEESSNFITGILRDDEYIYPNLYDRYFGVSETCKNSIKFGFETDYSPEYIHNPILVESKKIKPHLKLVSTLRYDKDKGINRIKKIAKILDENNIPYTWNVFTDRKVGTNKSGLIYRESVTDVLPYVKDADYLVMLSDVESFCYSIIESLLVNTKVIVTPVEVFKELGVKENENGFIIPFEYFERNQSKKLKEKIIEIYENKDKKIKYEPVYLNYNEFAKLLKK